jgi:hypothetical protein
MKDYGITHADERPITPDIRETKVFLAENIEEEEVPDYGFDEETGEETVSTHTGYKYRLLEYTKDEYIALLNEQVTNTQLALTELFEEMI